MAAQMKPIAPVMKKTQRQLRFKTIMAMSGGAMTAPRAEPVLKMPKATERSLGGNHSATALPEPGKPPPSPMPRRKRQAPKPATLETRPVAKLAADHQTIIAA